MDNPVEDVKGMPTILGFPCLFYCLMKCLQGALPYCRELDVMLKLVAKHDSPKQRTVTHSLCVTHSVSFINPLRLKYGVKYVSKWFDSKN